MTEMNVPTTDAFDEAGQFESLLVELTPRQIEWLEETAAERGLSIDRMLRSIIAAQMRSIDEMLSASAEADDGASRPSPVNVSTDDTASSDDAEDTGAPDHSDSPSIVESLRSASERLQNLTEKERPEEEQNEAEDTKDSGLQDTLERLQAHMDLPSEDDRPDDQSDAEEENTKTPSRTMLQQNQSPSMFDMVDDE